MLTTITTSSPLKQKLLRFILLFLLVADLGYSFLQHYHMPLDGDMAGGIVPAHDVQPVLADPFGFSAITEDTVYPNPNRFFAHWTFYTYFNAVPMALQEITDPVDSVYLACALAKTATQLLLILLLTFCITRSRSILNRDFLLTALLITPFFQTNGCRTYMGIIDPSITYTFFYALPCALLLLFYLPFFRAFFHKTEFPYRKTTFLLLALLAIFITLNGPLVPGIVLTISLLFLLKKRRELKTIPQPVRWLFLFISLLSLYSLFVGTHNSIFGEGMIPIGERYARLPIGVYYLIFAHKPGLAILLLATGILFFWLKRSVVLPEANKLFSLLRWISLFALLYILLLPLGGYKDYRPNILRYDTIMPITLAAIFLYGFAASLLFRHANNSLKRKVLFLTVSVGLAFTLVDRPGWKSNSGEKSALQTLAASSEGIVFLKQDCTVLSWEKITDPKQSELNGKLLQLWKITKERKRYYQR